MIKKDFGSIIANKRKDRKLSQPQLAALLCERGLDVKAHSISKWEKNVNLRNAKSRLERIEASVLRFPI